MEWQESVAVYIIGNRFPIATFVHENHAIEWAEANFPSEWIQKKVKVPMIPIVTKKSTQNLKNIANVLEEMNWTMDDEEITGEIIKPD